MCHSYLLWTMNVLYIRSVNHCWFRENKIWLSFTFGEVPRICPGSTCLFMGYAFSLSEYKKLNCSCPPRKGEAELVERVNRVLDDLFVFVWVKPSASTLTIGNHCIFFCCVLSEQINATIIQKLCLKFMQFQVFSLVLSLLAPKLFTFWQQTDWYPISEPNAWLSLSLNTIVLQITSTFAECLDIPASQNDGKLKMWQ